MKYPCYNSLDELLSPETLYQLTGKAITPVHRTPIEGGVSGSQVLKIETTDEQPQQFVLKYMSSQTDWLMQSSHDYACRSVTLWQYGLLDQLQPTIDHTILACAYDGDNWAMLMHDVSPYLTSLEPWSEAAIKLFLDTLATLHATFWESPELTNSAIGLCDAAGMIKAFSIETARQHPSETTPITKFICGGGERLQAWLDPDVADIFNALQANPTPLCQALEQYSVTLLHGDYRPQNLALRPGDVPQIIALDWQLAGRSIPTIDLAWFLAKPAILRAPVSFQVAADYYRHQLEQRLNLRFASKQWQAMLELGVLVDILRIGALRSWFAEHHKDEVYKAADQAALKQYNDQVRAAMRWL